MIWVSRSITNEFLEFNFLSILILENDFLGLLGTLVSENEINLFTNFFRATDTVLFSELLEFIIGIFIEERVESIVE